MLRHSFRDIINSRFINFAVNYSSSINGKVLFIANVSQFFVLYILGKNLNFVSAYNIFTVSQPNVRVLFELIMACHGLFNINILLAR